MTKEEQEFFNTCEYFVMIRQKSKGTICHNVGYPSEPTDKDLSALWAELEDDSDFAQMNEIIKNNDYEYMVINRTEHKEIVDCLLPPK